MTDDFSYVGRRKVYRRKRRFQGATWTPPSMSAEPEDGLWCRQCKKRHGYMVMHVSYEKRGTSWHTLWACPNYGTVLGDTSSDGGDNEGLSQPPGEG